ncbi:MAG TPA: hypothetical protein VNM34_15095 [Verrucomicrobiae bacterium]|nr:hypothetical protein [Verrucomicrobiae bacterium]
MSGTPTEAEIQSQWRAAIDVLETSRNFYDGTLAGGGGKFDVLLQLLEGDYTPFELAGFVTSFRAAISNTITPNAAFGVHRAALFEYARILKNDATVGFGSGFRNESELFRALYEWFVAKGLSVKSRAITYAGAVAGGANVGNGAMSRLTVDENNFPLEACFVEKKAFRCRQDQNSGVQKEAETFEFVGSAASADALLRSSFGSGESSRTLIVSGNAGAGSGGSLLTNSSFSEFNASSTPKFTAWDELAGSAGVGQDTSTFYRSFPNASVDASLKLTAGSGTITLRQTTLNMRTPRLDVNTPYFLRAMVNKTPGTAVGGSFTIRLGSQSTTVTIASLAAGWNEVLIPIGQNNWFRRFNKDGWDIQVEWSTPTSGYLLVDDLLFAPFWFVDGTWWYLRQNAGAPVRWLVDDVLTFTDTGGAPATGKIQYWLWVSGLGYLPSSGSPTFTDP